MKIFLIRFISTGCGVGYIPFAPGTWGSLIALLPIFLLFKIPLIAQIIFWICLFIIGLIGSALFFELEKKPDDSRIVIDEILGMGLCSLLIPQNIIFLLVSFFVFRFFDILKPPPIRQFDRCSKKAHNKWLHSFGVIFDDLLAGLFSALFIIIFSLLLEKLGV